MGYRSILVEANKHIVTITINRPQKLNALNIETIKELHHALKKVDTDKKIKVIIITGSGDKAFVAGDDISEFADFNEKQGKQLADQGLELLYNIIENLSKPVFAAVNVIVSSMGIRYAMTC